jgi:endoglucanase
MKDGLRIRRRQVVVATEFRGAAAAPPNADRPAYGTSIIRFLESRGVSWLVWCFDPEWGPALIKDWEHALTPSGEFARKAMHGEID